VTNDFPVLSAGPTPHTPLDEWSFTISGAVDEPVSWPWMEFIALPAETPTVDIHCVTKWSKLDTAWKGVSLDTLVDGVHTEGAYVSAWCDGGYTTNLPLEDVTGGKAWIAYEYEGEPLAREHGGPTRLLVPHLYFWKSAKWVRGLEILDHDEPGFWRSTATTTTAIRGRSSATKATERVSSREQGVNVCSRSAARARRPHGRRVLELTVPLVSGGTRGEIGSPAVHGGRVVQALLAVCQARGSGSSTDDSMSSMCVASRSSTVCGDTRARTETIAPQAPRGTRTRVRNP
jgi:hypothetical protein